SRNHDMRKLVVSTLLTRLELMGILRSEGFYYSDIRFAPGCSSDKIFSHYAQSQATFLRKMFSCCTMAKKWVTLNTDQAVVATGFGRSVILRALEDLQNKGLVQLQMAGYRQRFHRLQTGVDRKKICRELLDTFIEHEKMEIGRIKNMLAYAEQEGCLTSYLLNYFGESIDRCGHCGTCLGDPAGELHEPRTEKMVNFKLEDLAGLIEEYPNALSRPRQQARFLCGLNSPAVSAAKKLRGNPVFGRLEQVPFAEVLEYCQNNIGN
ncbi:MAG: RecQ family zinc-binding domain-containing protein, partial [Phycisphaerae bacterium]|nr:RecQ family zinc-binding domain-containing protein [Phycisphaerae bacterium]